MLYEGEQPLKRSTTKRHKLKQSEEKGKQREAAVVIYI